jgi:hypothetical protein
MKKIIAVVIVLILAGVVIYVYLAEGKKAVTMEKEAVETGNAQIDQAKQAVDKLNQSTEEQRKAADKLLGK